LESLAFRDLALKEMDSLYRMAMHLARNPEEASDLVQETYLKAFKAEGRFELRGSGVRPWLFKILHNNFYTRVGKKKREPILSDDLSYQAGSAGEPGEPGPAWDLEHLDWDHVDQRLKQAIEELPEHYRHVLLLWAVQGLKYREVAEVLDVPLGTVMSRLYRARSILAGSLQGLAAEHGIRAGEAKPGGSRLEG
jgi:RNA polymerase sigma-70 factor, ECF subfamily